MRASVFILAIVLSAPSFSPAMECRSKESKFFIKNFKEVEKEAQKLTERLKSILQEKGLKKKVSDLLKEMADLTRIHSNNQMNSGAFEKRSHEDKRAYKEKVKKELQRVTDALSNANINLSAGRSDRSDDLELSVDGLLDVFIDRSEDIARKAKKDADFTHKICVRNWRKYQGKWMPFDDVTRTIIVNGPANLLDTFAGMLPEGRYNMSLTRIEEINSANKSPAVKSPEAASKDGNQ